MNRVLVEPGVSGTTFFAFEDGAVIQIYAERPEGSDTWEVFDGRQFLCRALVMEVGNVWRFLDDEARGGSGLRKWSPQGLWLLARAVSLPGEWTSPSTA